MDYTTGTETPGADHSRADFIGGLHQIADFLDAHPEVPLPWFKGSSHTGGTGRGLVSAMHIWLNGGDAREQLRGVVRALGEAHKSASDHTNQFYVYATFGGIDLVAGINREEVCERVVVGRREIEVTEPDPAAVAALATVTRTKVIEDVRWECRPLLADANAVKEGVGR